MQLSFKCQLCNKNINIKGVGRHLKCSHNISSKEYYDEFLKKENEGICIECGSKTNFKNLNIGYFKYCSQRCISLNNEIKNKRKLSLIKKYGVENAFQSEKIKQKIKETNLNRYGVVSYTQTDECKQKIKETNLERYGVVSYTQTDECKQKIKETNLERYGVENVFSSNVIKNKIKQLCLNKYGVENAFQSEKIKQKIKETNLERYGVVSYTQTDECKQKSIQSSVEKYNVNYHSQLEIHKNAIKTKLKNYHEEKYIKNNINLNIININDDIITFKCNNCNNICNEHKQFIYIRHIHNLSPCTFCIPKSNGFSYKEKELVDYIKSIYNGKVIENNRSVLNGQELDIYLPEKKLAFEFNGLYWHSEIYRTNDYHLNKTINCEKQNIQLIHIFEDEWEYKQDIIKSRIKGFLGLNEKIYARRCIIKEISSKLSKLFLEENHIQGNCSDKYRYGLYYNNELVAIMTFGKSRFKNEFEMTRFCCKKYTNIIGGASKLFYHFIKNHPEINKIISFADRRWSVGNLYKTLNFKEEYKTKPSYYYIINDIRENRIKFQKHKLIKEGFDKNKSEHEIMLDREIYRIYDCGNLKYKYTKI